MPHFILKKPICLGCRHSYVKKYDIKNLKINLPIWIVIRMAQRIQITKLGITKYNRRTKRAVGVDNVNKSSCVGAQAVL